MCTAGCITHPQRGPVVVPEEGAGGAAKAVGPCCPLFGLSGAQDDPRYDNVPAEDEISEGNVNSADRSHIRTTITDAFRTVLWLCDQMGNEIMMHRSALIKTNRNTLLYMLRNRADEIQITNEFPPRPMTVIRILTATRLYDDISPAHSDDVGPGRDSA
ncbi:hypothetical protein INR49_015263 [Caranx melampygus]|nr:hypothetical protein INR49_015263 [Caranx melampygus]